MIAFDSCILLPLHLCNSNLYETALVVTPARHMLLSLSPQMPKIEPGVSHDLAAWRAAHYSDIRYKLNLTLEKMSPVLKGTIEIRVHVNTPAYGVIPIILDWRKIAGHENDSTITNVTINGISVIPPPPPLKLNEELRAEDVAPQYEQSNDHLILDYTAVGENVIKLDFTSPILTSGSAITRYIDKEDGSEYHLLALCPVRREHGVSGVRPAGPEGEIYARHKLS